MAARPVRKRMYKTMQGRMVDIEKLRAANENVKAVGNMNVNTRGDVIGPAGQIIKSKETVMREYYERPRGKVDETPSRLKSIAPRQVAPVSKTQTMTPTVKQTAPTEQKITQFKPKEVTPTEQAKPEPTTEQAEPEPTKKGIDAALDGIE